MYIYPSYRHCSMFLKKAYSWLSSRINYYYHFESVHRHPGKVVLQPGFLLAFSPEEARFLALCAESFQYAVDYSRGYWQKEITLVALPHATLLGNSGALILDGKVVVESVFDQLRLAKSPAFRSPALLWGENKKGTYTSLMHLPWAEKSNYHWFLDCLPRLYALMQQVDKPVNLVIPENIPAFQLDTLRFVLAHHPLFTLVKIKKTEKWRVEAFLLPSFISNHYSGFLPPPVSTLIRRQVWQGYQVSPTGARSRIYISRAKATKRRLVNESQVVALLQGFHFKVVYAEDLHYRDQVALFYDAEVVVGVHGAGLTNILFGTHLTLVELHPQDLVRSHYFMLCKALDFPYQYLIGDKANARQDFQVDIPGLREILNQVITA
jgi:hypothetical protein